MANTYQPKNYAISFSGEWSHATNIQAQPAAELGLAGICVTTESPEATIALSLVNDPSVLYSFNSLRVFFSAANNSYLVKLDSTMQSIRVGKDSGYVDVSFKDYKNQAAVTFLKNSDTGKVTLYGFVPMSDSAGVVYSSAGVTGAAVSSFLKCSLLESQLRTMIVTAGEKGPTRTIKKQRSQFFLLPKITTRRCGIFMRSWEVGAR